MCSIPLGPDSKQHVRFNESRVVLTGWPAPERQPAGAAGAAAAPGGGGGARAGAAGALLRRFPASPPLAAGAHAGPAPVPAVAGAEAEAVLRRLAPPPREALSAGRAAAEAVGLRVPGLGEWFDAVAMGAQAGGGRGLVPNGALRRAHPDDVVYC